MDTDTTTTDETAAQPRPAVAGQVDRELGPLVTSVRYMPASKPKPRAGDRRVTKKHGLQIRVQCRATDWSGAPIGLLMNRGRPVFEWREPQHLAKWDRYLLTPEEMARYFPPEREAGYMQQRGAA